MFAHTVAPGPIADLVVGGEVAEETAPGDQMGVDRGPVPASPERGGPAVVQEHLAQDVGKYPGPGEVGVVAVILPGQSDVQGVVQVIGPLGGHAHPAGLAGQDGARIVAIGLGDQ